MLLVVLTVLAIASGQDLFLASEIPSVITDNPGADLGYFLRSLNESSGTVNPLQKHHPSVPDFTHYRLLPGVFPHGMTFHFDGLATVMKLDFVGGHMKYVVKPYGSNAYNHWDKCLFAGTGTSHFGLTSCLTNPGVNLLPIEGELWLTIDTSLWGRVDPVTLDTLPNKAHVTSTVLNAHPACEPDGGKCFVQYPCSPKALPLTDQACFGILQPGGGDLDVVEISRVTLPRNKLIQHSHSPCLTPNFLVSKLDAFIPRNPINANDGLLRLLHQGEDNLWMVTDRRTNVSRVMESNSKFVNNHFWNCYEDSNGSVVVDAVAATEDYLDTYFQRNLEHAHANWDEIFHPPMRCIVPNSGDSISCEPFFANKDQTLLFDYPTFNPLYKMNPSYRFFYAIAASSGQAKWFDQVIKVDAQTRSVAASWSSPGILMTEFDFVPAGTGVDGQTPREDDGLLIGVIFNATDDSSSVALLDASNLSLRNLYRLPFVVPFHAHGIVCKPSKPCYPNP